MIVNYDHKTFIVQVTGGIKIKYYNHILPNFNKQCKKLEKMFIACARGHFHTLLNNLQMGPIS